jgi:hypothetical protein
MKKLLVALLVLGLAAPAMAADVAMYGSFRTHLGYYSASEEFLTGAPAYDGTIASTATQSGGFDDAGTVLTLSGQSRFGAKAKASDTLSAVFELGLTETTGTTQTSNTYLRLAYGTWNFGAGSLVMGKDYTPATFLGYSNMIADIGDQGEAILLVAGLPYIGRQPQLKLKIAGFEFALIEANNAAATVTGYASDKDFVLPRMELAYQLNTPMVSVRPVVGYQTYDVVNRGASETDKSIDSYVAGLGVQLRLGGFYANATGSYMINAGNYGETNVVAGTFTNLLNARIVNDSIEDSELTMATLALGFKINPMLRAEVGGSYNNVKVDTAPGISAEQTGFLYYAQLGIVVAPGVTITPEVGMVDRGDLEVTNATDVKQGELTYGVVSFRVDF